MQTKKRNKVKPTPMQRATLKGILDGKSKRQAMLDAGFKINTASHPQQSLVETTGFQTLIKDMDEYSKEKYGLDSSQKATQVVIDAMNAKKVVGTPSDFVETEDHQIRMQASDRVLKLKGYVRGEDINPNIKKRIVAEEFFTADGR